MHMLSGKDVRRIASSYEIAESLLSNKGTQKQQEERRVIVERMLLQEARQGKAMPAELQKRPERDGAPHATLHKLQHNKGLPNRVIELGTQVEI